MKKYYFTDGELAPDQTIELLRASDPADWIYSVDDQAFGNRQNLMVKLQALAIESDPNEFELVYGYQPVASVHLPEGKILNLKSIEVMPYELEYVPLGAETAPPPASKKVAA